MARWPGELAGSSSQGGFMARKRYGAMVGKIVLGVVLAVIAFLGMQYGSMLKAMDMAQAQYSQGDLESALKTYGNVEGKIRGFGAMRLIPMHDRQNLFLNQARILYSMKKYDEAADKLEKEDEITGTTTDGRFYLLRGEIGFRKAITNYQQSAKKDVSLLEENLLGSEDALRESLRLSPDDWDAKYNFEFVSNVRKSLAANGQEKVKLLEEEEKPQTKELPPELAG
jgi:tetratricopeptide (TPR) repeat protein